MNRVRWRHFAIQAFLLIVAYYPLLNWLIRSFGIPLASLWEEVVLITFLGIAVVLGWRRVLKLLSDSVVLTGLLYLAATLGSFAVNTYYVGAYIHEARLAFEPFIAFVIIALLADEDATKMLRDLVPHLVLCASIVAAIGVIQYVMKVPVPARWLDKDTESGVISTRAFSLFGSPNVLAAYLEMVLPLGIWSITGDRPRYRKLLAVACVLMMGTGFLLTLTRAAWLCAGASFLTGLLMVRPLFAVAFAAGGSVVLAVVPTFRLRMTNLLSSSYLDKSNNLGRLYRWRQAFVNTLDHPLLGSGLGTFGGSAAQKYGFFGATSMDSVWIRVLAETGIIGFCTFVGWMASAFANVAVRFFRSRETLWLYTSIGLLALLLNMFTDNLLDSWAIALLLWTLFGLGALPEAAK